jgi:hypothetical protein
LVSQWIGCHRLIRSQVYDPEVFLKPP